MDRSGLASSPRSPAPQPDLPGQRPPTPHVTSSQRGASARRCAVGCGGAGLGIATGGGAYRSASGPVSSCRELPLLDPAKWPGKALTPLSRGSMGSDAPVPEPQSAACSLPRLRTLARLPAPERQASHT